MNIIDRTVARINEEFNRQGNGARITLKNTGKTYAIYASNDNTYVITDQLSIWEEGTMETRVPTIEALAKLIISLNR